MDNAKKRKLTLPLILLISGVLLLLLGIIIMSFTDSDKYFPREDISENFPADKIQYLDIDIGIGHFDLETYDGDKIIIEAQNLPEGRYLFNCSDDKFSIKYKNYKWYEWYKNTNFYIGPFDWGNSDEPEFKILIPDKEYTSAKLNGGVGEYTVSGLKCVNVDIDAGVGNGRFTGCIISGKADIDMGVGECRFENCSVNEGDIDCDIGEFSYSGKILGRLDLDCGIGECRLDIDGYYSDYDIKKDTGIGEINIERNSDNPNGSAPIKIPIDIDGGIGEVNIKFK
ncbi:MAG: hypothetical protein U0M95_05590 [Ruminococcus sp.]